MTLYTRHGDKSLTTTFDGERVEKTSPTIAAYGDIDELISHLGLLRALISENIKKIQASGEADIAKNGGLVHDEHPPVRNSI